MEFTAEQFKEAARKAAVAGDAETARSLIARAKAAESAAKPFGQRAKEFFLGDDDPTTQNTGEKIGTWINKASEAATFGLGGDEANAAIEAALGGNYDDRLQHYRGQEALLEKTNPGAALSADIGGSVVGALLPGGAIGTLAKGASLPARIGASTAAGAGMGGVYGFMEGEGDSRAAEALTGAKWGAAGGAAAVPIAGAISRIADSLMQYAPRRAAIKTAKTAAAQRGASRQQYDVFRDADVDISGGAFDRLAANVGASMDDVTSKVPGPLGKRPKGAQKIAGTFAAMQDEMAPFAGQSPAPKLSALEDVRKEVGAIAREIDPKTFRPSRSAAAAMRARDAIDEFVDGLGPSDIASGDIEVARTALKKARAAWLQSIKTQKVENAIGAADRYLGGTESGLRNQIKSLLRANAKDKLFSAEEEAVLKKVIGNNLLSRAVRTLGDGLGRKLAAGGGFMAGGIEGAALGAAAGEAASQIGESAARRKAEIARALIATGALQNLPKLSDASRLMAETLARRIGVAAPQ